MRVPLWTDGRDLSVACGERSRFKAREPVGFSERSDSRGSGLALRRIFRQPPFREIEFHSDSRAAIVPGAPNMPPIIPPMATEDDAADHLQKLIRERFEIMTNFADLDRQAHELTKIFRKFDVDGSGSLTFDEFEKVLVEIKCNHVRESSRRALFDRYDDDLNGQVNLRELKDGVFNLNPHPLAKKENRKMLETIRAQLAKRGGANGVRSLQRIFRILDASGDGELNQEEFLIGLKEAKTATVMITPERFQSQILCLGLKVRVTTDRLLEDIDRMGKEKYGYSRPPIPSPLFRDKISLDGQTHAAEQGVSIGNVSISKGLPGSLVSWFDRIMVRSLPLEDWMAIVDDRRDPEVDYRQRHSLSLARTRS